MYSKTIAWMRSLPIGEKVHGVDTATVCADRLEHWGNLHAKLLSEQVKPAGGREHSFDTYRAPLPPPTQAVLHRTRMVMGVWVDES